MKYIKILIVLIFFAQTTNAQNVSFYIQIDDPELIPEITFNESTGLIKTKAKRSDLDKLLKKYKIYKFEKAFPTAVSPGLQNVYIIKCNNNKLGKELKEKYKTKIPRVEYKGVGMPTYDTNDYGLAMGQSHLDLINTKDAWDIILGLPIINIGVNDTGFDLSHEDLNMTLVSGSNTSSSHHGTSVAGCIGAISDNGVGLSSIAFNPNLFVSSNIANDNDVLLLAQQGNRVINCSWADTCFTNTITEQVYDEIRNVWNTLVVFGIGNAGNSHCGNNNPSYPGSYDSNIAVTSVGHMHPVNSSQAPFDDNNWMDVHEEVIGDSTSAHKHHPTVDICAPGYNISTTDRMGASGRTGGNYHNVWGTSFAAPQVAATLGLIISVNPCLNADEAEAILLNNADASIYTIPENSQYIGRLGAGRLDVFASVSAAAESATTYLQNITLSGTQTIEDNYAIRLVDDVTIPSGADISLITRKEVTIEKDFEIVAGAEFEIDVDVNNIINCN